jgi:hypothetical protein
VVMRSIAVCLRVHRCGKRNSPATYNLIIEPQPGLPTGMLRHTHTRGGFVTYRGRFSDLAAARAAVAKFLASRSSTLTVSNAGNIGRYVEHQGVHDPPLSAATAISGAACIQNPKRGIPFRSSTDVTVRGRTASAGSTNTAAARAALC